MPNSFEMIHNIIRTRRSIRQFKEDSVSTEDLYDLIDCARYAPSDTNAQPWEFIAITTKKLIQEIEDATWEEMHKKAASAEQMGKNREARLLLKSFGPYATGFAKAPVLVVCVATPYHSKFKEKIFDPIELGDEMIWREESIKSSCLAIQNLMLAAHAKGLATCAMTGPVLLAEHRLKEILKIEKEKQINMVLALGYPSIHPGPLPRKASSEIFTII